jgi:hypothetical protein
MPLDPSTATESLIGVKYGTLFAAFLGAAVSLSYTKELTRSQMVGAVVVGTAVSVYGAPLALHYLGLVEAMERPVSFFIGLSAMRFIPLVMDRVVDLIPFLKPKNDGEKSP